MSTPDIPTIEEDPIRWAMNVFLEIPDALDMEGRPLSERDFSSNALRDNRLKAREILYPIFAKLKYLVATDVL